MLGEFEYLLLSAASQLGDDAYGATIQRVVLAATGRRCSTGALYTTLDRLEAKGLVQTRMGNATAQRGGRRKRMVKVTAKGETEAGSFYRAVVEATHGAAWEAAAEGAGS